MQLMKMSLSTISGKGPPLAVAFVSYFLACLTHLSLPVSARSHFSMLSVGTPAFKQRSTAPVPQRPKAPMISTRGALPVFSVPCATAFLTSTIKASSLGYDDTTGNG
jgi:hypothetical protein